MNPNSQNNTSQNNTILNNMFNNYSLILSNNYSGFFLTQNIFTLINMKIKYILTNYYNYLIHQIFNKKTNTENMKTKIENYINNDNKKVDIIKNIIKKNKETPYVFILNNVKSDQNFLNKLKENSYININDEGSKNMKYFYDKKINNDDSNEYIEKFIKNIYKDEDDFKHNNDFNDIIMNIINSKK